MNESIAQRSAALFDSGFYCAESVLLAIDEARNVGCKLIPQIATGFCSGVARSCGMCGAISGAILAIGLAMGRSSADESVDDVYKAVRIVLDGFESEFGSSNCQLLLGCDLGTEEGQRSFHERKLYATCGSYVARATELALEAIEGRK
ncbi:C_GCAxxG_C_C family protein [Candidatus Bipolaricaulota bacterium]|nr:C_GCAxxG_C_C family protein [Candidatus Bipolaricaulota bacterium]